MLANTFLSLYLSKKLISELGSEKHEKKTFVTFHPSLLSQLSVQRCLLETNLFWMEWGFRSVGEVNP